MILSKNNILFNLDKIITATLFIFVAASIFSISITQIAAGLGGLAWAIKTHLNHTWKEQKWPLLNLVRQVLRSCHYKMTPKRVSAGYTKDGKKIFKRMFIIEKLNKIENNYTLDSSTLDTEASLSESVPTSSINA